jgi:general secretion pathway protein G
MWIMNGHKRLSLRPAARVRRAFTLNELLTVLIILGVLAAIVVPKFTGRTREARESAAKTNIKSFDTALEMFYTDNDRYPSNEEGLQALVPKYMKAVPADPWGTPYFYQYPGTHNAQSPDIFSAGADRQEGTEDDIYNWAGGQ